jgi:hypothetical protein
MAYLWVKSKPELLLAFDLIMNNISYKVAEKAPTKNDDPILLLDHLNKTYGEKNLMDAEEKFDTHRMNGIDPDLYITDLEILEGKIELAGGNVTPKQWFTVLSRNIHADFYQEFYQKIRTEHGSAKEITTEIVDAVKSSLKAWYHNTHADIRSQYQKKTQSGTALKTSLPKKNFEVRFCGYCKDHGHQKISQTHNEADCKAKGWDTERAKVAENGKGNKANEAYYDTGASNHMSPIISDNLEKSFSGLIETATGSKTPLIGSSVFKFGKIVVDGVLCAPGLDFNLVSGSQLAKDGYVAVIDSTNEHDLVISKDGVTMATGDFNDQDLLVINEKFQPCKRPVPSASLAEGMPLPTKNKFGLLAHTKTDHLLFGHLGCTSAHCDVCLVTKRRRKNTPKSSTPKEELQVLEKVHVDIQGPFPITSVDGTRMNIKAVDSHSGYVKMELIHDKSATTTSDFLRRFHVRAERQTGFSLKTVCTDSGNEFNGSFLSYLEQFGITKRKGHGYVHHYPPDAENANRIILMMARALLLQSKLPEHYYGEAMLCACYLLNRWTGSGNPSRYEKFFKKKPKIDHLQPFGSICYAFIPAEKRSKLDNTRERCRLIGYADDDDTEEMAGYKIVMESDESILYSNDVVFSSQDVTALPNATRNAYDPAILDVFISHDSQNDDFLPTDTSGTTAGSESRTPSVAELPNSSSVQQFDSELDPSHPDNASDTSEDYRQEAILQDVLERNESLFNQAPEAANESLFNQAPEAANESLFNQAPEAVSKALCVTESPIIARAFLTHKHDKSIPDHYKDALCSSDSVHWIAAIKSEEESLKKMGVFSEIMTTLPKGEKCIGSRWVFAKKFDEIGNLIKYKARLVAKGYMEKLGIDYEDTFAPVAHYNSIRSVTAIAASRNWLIYQDDMTTAFLNALLPHSKWIRLPDGRYIRIEKALYGLKEAPKEWFDTFKSFMFENNFNQSQVEPCLFFKEGIFVALYVDDTLSTGNAVKVAEFRTALQNRFKCGSGGLVKLYLGMSFQQDDKSITITQSHYIEEKLAMFASSLGPNENLKCKAPLIPQFQDLLLQANDSEEYEPTFPYRSMVGSLMHLVNGTRFDIGAATSVVIKFLHKPKKIHCDMVRKIYHYLRETYDESLTFKKNEKLKLSAYCDSSYANLENYSSLCGHLIFLGSTPVVWQSSRQPTIAKSTQQAEYLALTPAMQDLLWMQMLLKNFGITCETTPIYEDNEACISLANNPQSSKRTRHIQVIYHWIREHLDNKSAKLVPIGSANQLADIMTKGMYGPAMSTARRRCSLIRREYKSSGRNKQ